MKNYCIIRDDGWSRDLILQSDILNAQRVLLELFNAANKTKYQSWNEVSPTGYAIRSFSTDFATYTIKEVESPNE